MLQVGGAVGRPFGPADDNACATPAVYYALNGAGLGDGLNSTASGFWSTCRTFEDAIEGARPLLVIGDAHDAILEAVCETALGRGGQRALLGGTGQKCLAVAKKRADLAILNFAASAWDTCAAEALIRATGGLLTDLFGEPIVYGAKPLAPATYLNSCGVIASSAGYGEAHRAVCAAMRVDARALELLRPWGLAKTSGAAVPSAEAVESTLRRRREHLVESVQPENSGRG